MIFHDVCNGRRTKRICVFQYLKNFPSVKINVPFLYYSILHLLGYHSPFSLFFLFGSLKLLILIKWDVLVNDFFCLICFCNLFDFPHVFVIKFDFVFKRGTFRISIYQNHCVPSCLHIFIHTLFDKQILIF